MAKQASSVFCVDVIGLEGTLGQPTYIRMWGDAPPLLSESVTTPRRAIRQRHPSRRASDLKSYPGHYRSAAAMPFTPSLPPINLFPRKVWNRLLNREAARPGNDYWAYGASNGSPALREAIAAHASAMRGTCCSPDQVIVVTSTQQAVELARQGSC
jgi:GntR family transcriptional regulator/MocR family aminotransferase